ncbi:hypothetical protein BKE38_19920 [Pseudoroseomonas deserti]|uniref:Alpha 1,4-glycosyltransferase domain-containing protein n=1 Tax=Teichococcus deserti TaxID=1817963 RepID=A0A1V2GYM7_9PROT|nr:hypothetical protein [Pseudoroseomonas deserti]ONG50016.1 hypothetical protein BKE38_19920 [Pseudoroseomonas deserti]
MPQIFQSFWHGGALSPYEWLCLKSFIDHGHGYHLYSHDPHLSVPQGVQLMDAAEIAPADEVFVYQTGPGKGSVSSFANLFRYELLLRRGGWWVDTDVCCTSTEVPAQPRFFAIEAPERANCAVIHFAAGDPVMRDCRDAARRRGHQVTWGQTGPRLLTATLRKHGLLAAAAPAASCYPFTWQEVLPLFDPAQAASLQERARSAFCVHFWNEIIRRLKIDKRLGVPKGCYLDTLFTRHGVSFPPHPGYSFAELGALEEALAATERQARRIAELEAAVQPSQSEGAPQPG